MIWREGGGFTCARWDSLHAHLAGKPYPTVRCEPHRLQETGSQPPKLQDKNMPAGLKDGQVAAHSCYHSWQEEQHSGLSMDTRASTEPLTTQSQQVLRQLGLSSSLIGLGFLAEKQYILFLKTSFWRTNSTVVH